MTESFARRSRPSRPSVRRASTRTESLQQFASQPARADDEHAHVVSKHAHDVVAGLEIWSREASVAAQQRVDGAPALVIMVDVEAGHRLGRRFVAEGVGRNVWSGERADVWREWAKTPRTLHGEVCVARHYQIYDGSHRTCLAMHGLRRGRSREPTAVMNQSINRPRRRRRRF